MPDFVPRKVPLVNIGRRSTRVKRTLISLSRATITPEFQRAFRELNELLAAEFRRQPAGRVHGPYDVRVLG